MWNFVTCKWGNMITRSSCFVEKTIVLITLTKYAQHALSLYTQLSRTLFHGCSLDEIFGNKIRKRMVFEYITVVWYINIVLQENFYFSNTSTDLVTKILLSTFVCWDQLRNKTPVPRSKKCCMQTKDFCL
jgi:hypothetical protein